MASVKSHQLKEFHADKVFDVVQKNMLLAFEFFVASWGDCLDRIIYKEIKKRSPEFVSSLSSFLDKCEKEYTSVAVGWLKEFIPTKSKGMFLEILYLKYEVYIKPWVINELKKKHVHVKLKNETIRDDKIVTHINIVMAIHYFAIALVHLLKYKNTCMQREVHEILRKSKPMQFKLLKGVHSKKKILGFLKKFVPILGPIRNSQVAVNIIKDVCTVSDKDMIKFVDDMTSVIMNPIESGRLARHVSKQFKASTKKRSKVRNKK